MGVLAKDLVTLLAATRIENKYRITCVHATIAGLYM